MLPSSALRQYVSALGIVGPTRVVRSYRNNSAVIVINSSGPRSGGASLPPPSWGVGARGCLDFYVFPTAEHG
jgi:hypothetical protein